MKSPSISINLFTQTLSCFVWVFCFLFSLVFEMMTILELDSKVVIYADTNKNENLEKEFTHENIF